jgi:hypothetical protein
MSTTWYCFPGVHLVAFISLYSKLIGWVIDGRKYVAQGGDWAFLVVVLFWYKSLVSVLFFPHFTIQVSGLLYYVVVTQNIFYLYIYIYHGVVQNGGSNTLSQ